MPIRSRTARVAGCLLVAVVASSPGAVASVSVYLDPVDLADRAVVVVEGVVVETASGLDPRDGRLATYVTLEIEDVLRGPRDLRRVVLREPGGRFRDLVHAVDAVPTYAAGERVLAFLEPAPDGSLRTAGMFFGKFAAVPDGGRGPAVVARDLDGQGTIVGRPAPAEERFRRSDLVATVATARGERRTPAWSPEPPELAHLAWDTIAAVGSGGPATEAAAGDAARAAARLDAAREVVERTRFVMLSSSNPVRWYETDSGGTVQVDVERARDPLGDPSAAVAKIAEAMAAWTAVPESRLALAIADDDANHTGAGRPSPAKSYPARSIVLFGDPYEDISDPTSCSGVLAIGGYWRSTSTGSAVNGTTFHPALRAYVIFNDGFECFLAQPGNLSEVAAHEFGHAAGFGHSLVADAIMRSSAYGWGRGARLGDDDRDAAHCVYPHALDVVAPDGGETIAGGSTYTVRWSVSPEAGGDPGVVDLQSSDDGGATWRPIASGTPNDGAHAWTVPETAGTRYRVRVVRPNRVQPTPSPWPSACSQARSAADFRVTAPPPVAGSIPDGAAGEPLRIDRAADGGLALTWGGSCSAGATDYAVYAGSLTALRAGTWDHAPATCSTAGATAAEIDLPAGDVYFLVAPLASGSEGLLGADGSGVDRPASTFACAPREASSTCSP